MPRMAMSAPACALVMPRQAVAARGVRADPPVSTVSPMRLPAKSGAKRAAGRELAIRTFSAQRKQIVAPAPAVQERLASAGHAAAAALMMVPALLPSAALAAAAGDFAGPSPERWLTLFILAVASTAAAVKILTFQPELSLQGKGAETEQEPMTDSTISAAPADLLQGGETAAKPAVKSIFTPVAATGADGPLSPVAEPVSTSEAAAALAASDGQAALAAAAGEPAAAAATTAADGMAEGPDASSDASTFLQLAAKVPALQTADAVEEAVTGGDGTSASAAVKAAAAAPLAMAVDVSAQAAEGVSTAAENRAAAAEERAKHDAKVASLLADYTERTGLHPSTATASLAASASDVPASKAASTSAASPSAASSSATSSSAAVHEASLVSPAEKQQAEHGLPSARRQQPLISTLLMLIRWVYQLPAAIVSWLLHLGRGGDSESGGGSEPAPASG